MTNETPTVTIDGITYNTSDFSEDIQRAIQIYNSIQADFAKEQLAVIKSQAALQAIGTQISEAVKKVIEKDNVENNDVKQ
jgi:hypothetical protein